MPYSIESEFWRPFTSNKYDFEVYSLNPPPTMGLAKRLRVRDVRRSHGNRRFHRTAAQSKGKKLRLKRHSSLSREKMSDHRYSKTKFPNKFTKKNNSLVKFQNHSRNTPLWLRLHRDGVSVCLFCKRNRHLFLALTVPAMHSRNFQNVIS